MNDARLTDHYGHTARVTPTEPIRTCFEIPVVFVVDASDFDDKPRSEADAARIVMDALNNAGVPSGGKPIDSWHMPANQDIDGGQENRAGTILYGRDCEMVATVLQFLLNNPSVSVEDINAHMRVTSRPSEEPLTDRMARVWKDLSQFVFDGA